MSTKLARTSIRKASPADLKSIASLCGEVQVMHARAYPHIFKSLTKLQRLKWLERIINDRKHFLFVAVCGGQVEGYILLRKALQIETPFQKRRSFLYLDQIDVSKSARNFGIGKALLSFAKDQAHSAQCSELVLDVWQFNRRAVRFFEGAGLKPIVSRMAVAL